MTIKQLTEIVDGSLTPSNQKLDADLIEISSTDGNALQVSEDGLLVDVSQLATKTELQEVLTTLEVTPPSEWELTNAYILNNYLTYISDGNPYGTLYARKSLGIGESVTIDFQFDQNRISGLKFAADDGTSTEGSYSSESAVILQDLTSAILIAQQDWNSDYKVYVNDSASYKATIVRLAKSRILLSMSDVEGNLLISRDVTIGTADINRVWLHVSLYGNPGDTISYGTNITVTPGGFASSASLDLKVDKEEGKGLSTNDFTNELKEKLIRSKTSNVTNHDGSVSRVFVKEQGEYVHYEIDTPSVGKQMRTNRKDFMNTAKVNSVPLYSLDNDGEFVLTEPDTWVSFNDSNFVFPVYHLSTVDTTFLKGIVTLSAEMGADGEGNPTLDFKYSHNITDVIDGYELYINPTSLSLNTTKFPHTFTSSNVGETIFGTIKVPLTYEEIRYSLQQAINDFENLRFELVLTSGGKRTVMVRTVGITQNIEQ